MNFEVVVVGAGPAGCAAAIRAATHGLRVALVEKAAFPRNLPGEALHPDVERIFDELGVAKAVAKAGFIRPPGWIRDHCGERGFMPFEGQSGIGFGYQAWRSQLDSILLAQARRAGVTVLQPVAGMEVTGEHWPCRYVVDASGSARWLSRRLKLRVENFSPRLVARYGYFQGACDLGIIPEFREHACGWTWLARVRKDCCQCVQLSLGGTAEPPVPPPPFNGVRFRGADVTWRLVPECAGTGYFLCGDAAAVLDPAASSGVERALAGGLKAADLMIQVLNHGMDPHAAAALYREWCANQFVGHARQLAARYAELEHPPVWLSDFEPHFGLANAETAVITSS